jgi:hypothetical protein
MKKIIPLCILAIITTGKISGTFTETRAVYPNIRRLLEQQPVNLIFIENNPIETSGI